MLILLDFFIYTFILGVLIHMVQVFVVFIVLKGWKRARPLNFIKLIISTHLSSNGNNLTNSFFVNNTGYLLCELNSLNHVVRHRFNGHSHIFVTDIVVSFNALSIDFFALLSAFMVNFIKKDDDDSIYIVKVYIADVKNSSNLTLAVFHILDNVDLNPDDLYKAMVKGYTKLKLAEYYNLEDNTVIHLNIIKQKKRWKK